jgi:2-dehydro-3-deoxyphosphogluconate aldolase/(4S)-4-hydroxy-2-oxoglutarate aldolase
VIVSGTESRPTLAELLGPQRVMPLVGLDDVGDAARVAELLVDNGLPAIEIALRTDAALPSVETIRARVPGAVVGVGTVRTAAEWCATSGGPPSRAAP